MSTNERIQYLENKIQQIDASLSKMWGKPELNSRYLSCMEIAAKYEAELEVLKSTIK
jgi:hypothetical protein